jgi:SAM-dependent MidA family methyltransferase
VTPAEAALRALIAERGTVPYDAVVELALYDADVGFYVTGGQAGRRGDFLTSPEVGPLFGAVVARALDRWWEDAGCPDVFTVVEAGAGPGTLARSVLAADPACATALRYVLVERSASQRATYVQPTFASLAEVPSPSGPCVVLANELLDNLPFGLLERTADGWAEVHVGLDGTELVEVLVPTDAAPSVDAPVGARVPRQTAAADWVRDAIAVADRVVAIDYASTTAELSARPWSEWVRTYRQHERGGLPLDQLGLQDITCEVAIDQLPAPTSNSSQADWLRAHGIDDLVAEGRDTWQARAAVGDLAAVRALSRVNEAAALLDPTGLGAFRVLEWTPSPQPSGNMPRRGSSV